VKDLNHLTGHGREVLATIRARLEGLAEISLIGWITLVAMLWIAWRSWHWTRDAAPEGLPAARAGLATVGLLFTAVLTVWCWS